MSKDIWRLIRASKGRFLSLTMIVMIGMAFFIGVSSSSSIMAKNVDAYSDRLNLKDITIYSNYGFDEEDLEKIRSLDMVASAESSKFVDVYAASESNASVARIHSYDPEAEINQFVLVEGRLPVKKDEVLAEGGTDMDPGPAIGSVLILTRPAGDLEDWLDVSRITVVGRIDTPLYLNMTKENSTLQNQYIQTYFYIPEEAFNIDYDLEISVLLKDAKSYQSFYTAYEKFAEDARQKIEEETEGQTGHRHDEVLADAWKEYNDGLKEYNDGRQEFDEKIADAEAEIADAEAEIADGQKEIRDGEKKLRDAQKELDDAEEDGYRQIREARAEISRGQGKLQDGIEEFEQTKKEMKQYKKMIDDGIAQLEEGIAQLNQAQEGLSQIDDGIGQLNNAEAQIQEAADGLRQINDGIAQIDENLPAVEQAEAYLAQIEEGINQLETASSALAQIDSQRSEINEQIESLTTVKNTIQSLLDRNIITPDTPVSTLTAMSADLKKVADSLDLPEDADIRDFMSALDTALAQADAGLTQLNNARAQITEGLQAQGYSEETLNDTIASLKESRQQILNRLNGQSSAALRAQREELVNQKTQIEQALSAQGINPEDIDAALAGIRAQKEALQAQRQQIVDSLASQGIDASDIPGAVAEMQKKIRELQAQKKQIDDGLKSAEEEILANMELLDRAYAATVNAAAELAQEVEDAQKEINDGWAELEENRQKLLDGIRELEDARTELEDARKDGEQELQDAEADLIKAKQDIEDLEEGKWTILDRQSHYASRTYKGTVETMEAIAAVFPMFFIMVAALVCLTTMTRMVDEQRGQLGIMRALGYTQFQCASKYLIYAGLASLIGEVAGSVLGILIVPPIVYTAWKMMYVLPDMKIYVPWHLILVASLVFMAVMLLTTWRACRGDMKEVPAQLLRPKAPKLGKNTILARIPVIWNMMSFTWKVTIRNLVRYKKRLVMTIIGVAGCTALLITGFGVRDSINSMVDIQFGEIILYEGSVKAKDLKPSEMNTLMREVQAREDVEQVYVVGGYTALCTGNTKNLEETVSVQVFEDLSIVEKVYDLRTRIGHKPLSINNEGVIINERLSENLHVKKGDTLTLESNTGVRREVVISDICEMYINHYLLMSQDYYRKVFGTKIAMDTMLVKINGDKDVSQVFQQEIVKDERISEITFYQAVLENFKTMVNSIDLIVWILIISSMSLAFVVLGNLMNINISERQREIATLKVLGFHRREVENYIYKENNILTILGAFAGIPVGIFLHRYIMGQVEMDYVIFGRRVFNRSLVFSVLMTIGFGLLVNLFMRRNLQKIQMVESLKSVE